MSNILAKLFDQIYIKIISAKMAEPNSTVSADLAQLIEAIKSGSLEETQRLLREYGPDITNRLYPEINQPALYFAALAKTDQISSQLFKLLIRHGANYKFKDRNEQTVLFYVCRQGKQKCAEILLSQGLNLDDVDLYGQTAMFYAVSENRAEIVRKYATKQRVNLADKIAGQTPLYYAAKRGHLEICKILIEKGANVAHIDSHGKTAAECARKNKCNEVADFLNSELKRTKEFKMNMQSYSLEESTQRRKKDDNQKSQRQTYKIVFLNEKGEPHDLTEEEVRQLIRQKPQLETYLANPEQIPQQLVTTSNQQNWIKIAIKILAQCSKLKGCYWFTEPVDPVKYNILDYFEVISNPMDLGTIRKKLMHNCYLHPTEFVSDMSLIWENCYKYNGETHDISRCAKQLQTSFKDYKTTYGLDRFLENK